jgi:hypothetical protein
MPNITFFHPHDHSRLWNSSDDRPHADVFMQLGSDHESHYLPKHIAFPTLVSTYQKTGNPIPVTTSLNAVSSLLNELFSHLQGTPKGIGSAFTAPMSMTPSENPEKTAISSTDNHKTFGSTVFCLTPQLSELSENESTTEDGSQETSVQALSDLIGGIEIDEDIDFHDLSTWVMNVNNGMIIK